MNNKYVDCRNYVEDPFICFGDGEPKGQCQNCGAKWYEHRPEALPEHERQSAEMTRRYLKLDEEIL